MTSPALAKPRLHLAPIDGLRALCALCVVIFHAESVGHIFPDPLPFFLRWITWGNLAVPAFIVISGFCLMMPVLRKGELAGGVKNFYGKRIRRILPPYYVALLFFIVFNHVKSGPDILLHFLLLHNFRPDTFFGNINHSFWSIAIEFQIYLLFPLFVMAYRKWGFARSASVFLPLIYIVDYALQYTPLWGLCFSFTGLFLIGAAGAAFAFSSQAQIARLRERVPWLAASGVFASVFALLACLFGRETHSFPMDATWVIGWQSGGYNLLVALAVSCLLVSATVRDNAARKLLSWKPLVWVGSFSYSLYLLHEPFVIYLAGRLYNHHVPAKLATPIFLVFIPVIIGVSYIFHLCFERPFMSSPAPKTERQAEQAAIDSPAP